jgi:hypothetical protein
MTSRRRGLAITILFAALGAAFPPGELWSKLVPPQSMADEQEMARDSDVIFRGTVIAVETDPDPLLREWGTVNGVEENYNFIAKFRVERVYRGKIPEVADLHFSYGPSVLGHD